MNKPPSRAADASAHGGHRVLLVDDEEPILSALKRLLRREPYELAATTSPDEAVRMLEGQPASLVISDQKMVERMGSDFLREVRQRWPETVRIILSAYPDVIGAREAIRSGAIYKYLIKPWNDEEIKLEIRGALEQYDLAARDITAHHVAGHGQRPPGELAEQAGERAAGSSHCRAGQESRPGAEGVLSENQP